MSVGEKKGRERERVAASVHLPRPSLGSPRSQIFFLFDSVFCVFPADPGPRLALQSLLASLSNENVDVPPNVMISNQGPVVRRPISP